MDRPLVSVIIPLFNYQKYIKWCLNSIIKQTYDNIEIIVINDCSTDNSVEVVKKIQSNVNNIILIELKKNSGYSVAKNEGIIVSKGEIITVLDADDMMTKKSIEKRERKLIESGKPDFGYPKEPDDFRE